MNFLSDIITYVRRIIKSPSNAVITDNLIIDYINRFWIMDVDARLQLFDLKTKYQFQTSPGVDQYNMPLYSVQSETPNNPDSEDIGMYPVYQGFMGPASINGVPVIFETQKNSFFNFFPNVIQNNTTVGIGNGSSGPYTLTFSILGAPSSPLNPPLQGILRGHVDMAGVISTGVNQDPPLISNNEILASNTFIQDIPTTNVFPNVYFTSIGEDGSNVVICDSGQFLETNVNVGLLMQPGPAPLGNLPLSNGYGSSFAITGITQANPAVLTATTNFLAGQTIKITNVAGMTQLNGNTYTVTSVTPTTVTIDVDSTGFTAYVSSGFATSVQNTINYLTGIASNVFFPKVIPEGANINGQCLYFQTGLPRAILFYNNTLTLRSPPSQQFLVELDAYLSPAAFFNTGAAIPFGYMAEYIARGAARKLLSDTGDVEQFMFYEPLFKEQELLVWKRSQRQWTSTRTPTIYSQGMNQGQSGFNNMGASSF